MGNGHKGDKWAGLRLNHGMSVIEVLVGLSVLAVVSLATVSFFRQQQEILRDFTPYSECRSVLEGQMNYIRQLGIAPAGLPWAESKDPNQPAPVALTDNLKDAWLHENFRYTPFTTVPLLQPTAGNESLIRNFALQKGAMGLLNSLYNHVPNICADPLGVDTSTLPAQAASIFVPTFDQQSMVNFTSRIRIEPIRLLDGNPDASCPQPLWVRPQGVSDFEPNKPYVWPAEVSSQFGFRVHLSADYIDGSGQSKSCRLAEDFRYPIDKKVQSVSVHLTAVDDPAIRAAHILPPEADALIPRPRCTHKPGMASKVRIEIGFRPESGSVESGTVFLCSDVSEQMNPNYCPGAVDAEMQGENYNVGGNTITDANKKWVPCNEVTACGIPPAMAYIRRDQNNPSAIKYILDYDGSRGTSRDGLWGCDIRIDVASVDLAGNFKKLHENVTADPAGSYYAKQFFQPVDCYACFKRKKRRWGKFIISSIMFGPLISCLTHVGGVCKPKGLRHVGNSCNENLPGSHFCRKMPQNRPAWAPATNKCAEMALRPPATHADQSFSLPIAVPGTMYEDVQTYPNGTYCEIQGYCDDGTWRGIPDEDNRPLPFVRCGKIFTEYKINISNLTQGQKPTGGTPNCVVPVPDDATDLDPLMNFASYTPYKACLPQFYGGGTVFPTKILCDDRDYWSSGESGPIIYYPPHARTGRPNNMNPDEYFYYQHDVPTPQNLPPCEVAPEQYEEMEQISGA